MPASIAWAVRSFSALKRLKTWLRNIVSEDRLSGLVLLHVHYDKPNDIDQITDLFAQKQ